MIKTARQLKDLIRNLSKEKAAAASVNVFSYYFLSFNFSDHLVPDHMGLFFQTSNL